MLVQIATSNTERLAQPLVERLGPEENLPQRLVDYLLASYSERTGEA